MNDLVNILNNKNYTQFLSLVKKLAEAVKRQVELKQQIDDFIEELPLQAKEKNAFMMGIMEYVDYAQFCTDDINDEIVALNACIQHRNESPFRSISCPFCKQEMLPLYTRRVK